MPDKHGQENQCKSEDTTRHRKPVDKKYSNQVEELSEKPAMNILKKTFTSMLTKVQLGRSHIDDSSEDDDCRASNIKDKKNSDKEEKGICFCLLNCYQYMFVGGPGKKTFMYFSSDAGTGFIISDD